MLEVSQTIMDEAQIDYLDLSLKDTGKQPYDERFAGRSLLSYFTEIDRGPVRVGAAGKVRLREDAEIAMAEGADFVFVGRAAIAHHDFPIRVLGDQDFTPLLPAPSAYLKKEGVSQSS